MRIVYIVPGLMDAQEVIRRGKLLKEWAFPNTEVDTQELAQWVAETLAPFKVPAHWEVRDTPLPRNALGKVMKHVLVGEEENTFTEE